MPRVLLLLALLAASSQQQTPMSPCPNVFSYEPPGSEPGRWYGVVNLSTDSILHSVWINIVLDSKADILGNWIGDVTTADNTDFKIENTKMRIHPGPATAVRFFVQYNPLNKAPKVTAIRLNGREICNSNTPLPAVDRPDDRRTTRPDIRPEDTPQSRPVYGQPSAAGPVYSSTQNPVPQNPVNLNIGGGPTPAQSVGSQTSTGTQTGSGFGSGTQTGSNFGSGTQTGSGYGSGTQSGNGFGSGTGTQTGSDYGSQTSSGSQGGNGFGSGTGTQTGSSYGSQTSSGTRGGNGFSSNTQTGSNLGSGTQGSNGFGSGSQTGSNFGTGTQSGSGTSGISTGTSNSGRPDNGHRLTTAAPMRTTTRYDDEDDFDDKNQYFEGPQPTFIVASRPNNNNNNNNNAYGNNNGQTQCGKVVRNSPNPLVVNGKTTLEGQWPWQIALYQTQTVDNKYICGGTLVSRSHVITAAHCVTRKGSNRVVNQNTLTVYLGKHNLRTSVEGVQIKLVGEIRVHPSYNASSYSRDVSVLKLREQASYTDWVRPACLWPDNEIDLSNVIGKKGSVVGWGFDDKGVATEELTLVEMPVVDQETCIRSYSEFFARFTSDFTFCAGYKDGSSVCNGDSGGGMVFYMRNAWFLRGIVSLSVARQNEYRCDPTHYVVFTDLAKFLPWIRQNINDE